MTPRRLEFHPDAEAEADAALCWYAERSPIAAAAFLIELDFALSQIDQSPDRWPAHRYRTRRYLMHRFPFLIIYRTSSESIQIVAIAHGSRRPAYWKRRTH